MWYDQRRELRLSADAPLPALFDRLAPPDLGVAVGGGVMGAAIGAAPTVEGAAVGMRRGGGASSSSSSTYMADGTEWSATGRLGVSLAALSGLQDAAFARRRTGSRLAEMLGSAEWPTTGPGSSGGADSKARGGAAAMAWAESVSKA